MVLSWRTIQKTFGLQQKGIDCTTNYTISKLIKCDWTVGIQINTSMVVWIKMQLQIIYQQYWRIPSSYIFSVHICLALFLVFTVTLKNQVVLHTYIPEWDHLILSVLSGPPWKTYMPSSFFKHWKLAEYCVFIKFMFVYILLYFNVFLTNSFLVLNYQLNDKKTYISFSMILAPLTTCLTPPSVCTKLAIVISKSTESIYLLAYFNS